MHPVYFIGAGPGDPDLMTLLGARHLAASKTVFVADPFAQTFAELLQGKEVLIPFDYDFDDLLQLIETSRLDAPVSFLIPGDLTFYAPFQALVDALGEQAVVIPGVGCVNAASAHLKKTLDLPGICNRAIIASPRTLGDDENAPTLQELAAPGVTLLIFMNNIPLPELVDILRAGYGGNVPIALLHRLGLPGEVVIKGDLDSIVDLVGGRDFFNLESKTTRPALTLVIVGETLTAVPDGSWWDYRREHIWKCRS
jgi:precorrin-4/cobalt-precorrin-4 C11-methyltransferase